MSSRRARIRMEPLEDRSVPTSISLSVSPGTFLESAGAAAATGTVTRDGDLSQPLTVNLTTSDATAATVPATVTIPADQPSATFPVAAVDDPAIDGPQTATLTARAFVPGPPVGVDPTFGVGGSRSVPMAWYRGESRPDMAVQPDGKVVAAGMAPTPAGAWLITRLTAAGAVDTTFGNNGLVTLTLGSDSEAWVNDVEIQSDGKILLAGYASGGALVRGDCVVVRLTAGGVLDNTFGTGGVKRFESQNQSTTAFAIRALPDGKILLSGTIDASGFALARLNSDGTQDMTFGGGLVPGWIYPPNTASHAAGYALTVAPDGKIVHAGFANNEILIARYTAAGQLDTTFDGDGWIALPGTGFRAGFNYARALGVTVMPDGRVVAVGWVSNGWSPNDSDMAILRLTAAGALDTTFDGDGRATLDFNGGRDEAARVVAQSDGKVLLSGYVCPTNGSHDFRWSPVLARLNPDGSRDAAFDGDGRFTLPWAEGQTVEFAAGWGFQPDGRLVMQLANVSTMRVVRLDAGQPIQLTATTGVYVLDNETNFTLSVSPTSFSESAGAAAATATLTRTGPPGESYTVTLTSRLPGRVTVPTSVTFDPGQTVVTVPVTAVDNAASDGNEDVLLTATGPDGGAGTLVRSVTVTVTDDEPPPPDPTLTLTLGGPLPEHAGANARTATLTRSGGYVNQPLTATLASSDTTELTVPASITFAAHQTSVTFPISPVDDTSLDGDQTVTVTVSLPGSGISGPITFQTYYPTSVPLIAAVAVGSDGKLVAAGRSGNDFVVKRYRTDYSLDPTWGTNGQVVTDISGGADTAEGLYLYPDGRVLVVGTGPGGAADLVLARYTAAGALDTTFDGDGKLAVDIGTGAYNEAWDVTVSATGQIVLAVTTDRGVPTSLDFAALRLNANGSRDTTFGVNGLAVADFAEGGDRAVAVTVQPDGRVLVAGEAGPTGNEFGVVRFTAAGMPDATFGNNGRVLVDLPGDHAGVSDILLRPDGRIVLVGRAGRPGIFPPVWDPALVQLTVAGALDTTFGINGVRVQNDTTGTAVYGPVEAVLQDDGRVVVLGTVGASRTAARTRVMRFGPTGTLENATTGPFTQSVAEDVAVAATGHVYVAYSYGSAGSSGYVDRYFTPPGSAVVASAAITIQDNEPFTAVADSYVTLVNSPLVVSAAQGVRANDVTTRPIDPRVELVSAPTLGTVELAADGSFVYTPPAGYAGHAFFSYRVRDGVAVSGTVFVGVRMNTRPVAAWDSYTTAEDTPVTGGMVIPPPSSLPLRFGFDEPAGGTGPAANGGSLAAAGTFHGVATRIGEPAYTIGRSAGAVNLSTGADGYVSAGDLDALDALPGITVALWVRLTALPNNGDVIAEDWRPTSPFPPAGSRGWSLSYDSVSATNVGVVLRIHESSGTSTGSQGIIVNLSANTVLNRWVFLAFNYDPNDTSGTSRAASIFVGDLTSAVYLAYRTYFANHLGGPNDAPLTVGGSPYPAFGGSTERTAPAWFDEVRVYDRALTRPELETVRQTTGPMLGLLANDSDADGDPLTVQTVTPPAHGSVAWNPDGSFTYTPYSNFHGTDTFTYRAFDGYHSSDPALVTITVTPVTDVEVEAFAVNGGQATRSRVTDLTLTFDAELDTALLAQPGAFTLTRAHDGATAGAVTAAATVAGGRTTVVLTFAGANTEAGSLADGRWTVTADRDFVRSTGGVHMAADYTSPVVHRLFGDTDGDADVDQRDLYRFRQAFGRSTKKPGYRADLDVNQDGWVDTTDLVQFRRRYGQSPP